jgi:uncharacterized protein YpmB
LERKGRREAIIILIIMLIIAAVIISWLTGLWSYGSGKKDLTEKQRLTIADYINSISVLIQHSNKISINFFNTLGKIKDTPRDALENNITGTVEESNVVLANCEEINPPDSFEVANGYLKLVFQTRSKAYESFKPALSSVMENKDTDATVTQIASSFLNMYMSDEIFKYFQDELKKTGEKLGISNLTIIDSSVLQGKNLIDSQNVISFISDIKTSTSLQERRGVAVISQSIIFNPAVINEQDEYLIIGKGSEINVTINIENQGNVVEKDVNVKMTYKVEGISKTDEKSYIITTINPSDQKSVTISGFKAYPGKKCEITIEAGPVPNEVLLTNNTIVYKFMMEEK